MKKKKTKKLHSALFEMTLASVYVYIRTLKEVHVNFLIN